MNGRAKVFLDRCNKERKKTNTIEKESCCLNYKPVLKKYYSGTVSAEAAQPVPCSSATQEAVALCPHPVASPGEEGSV